MRGLAVPSVLLLVTACSCARAPGRPALASTIVEGPAAAGPLVQAEVPLPDVVPLSIKRLLSEQRTEIADIRALVEPIADVRGRARATGDVDALASELADIQSGLRVTEADSERFDATVVKLQLLSTRTSLMHEALRGAVATTALELDPVP